MSVDLGRYLARIGHAGPARPDLTTLQSLHARHADAIAFENFSAFLGEPVPLDLDSLQRKLLTPGRGGWCFEHNLLFGAMLEAAGFEVRRLAARVRWNVPENVTTARSHMLLLVHVGAEPYIADVGFGGQTLTAPLRLQHGIEQSTPHEPHRVMLAGERYSLQSRVAGEWQTLYLFDLQRQEMPDYEVSNWYLANHPQSQFVKGILAARAAPDRRHALRNTRYAVHHRDGRTERRFIDDPREIKRILAEDFRLKVPDSPLLDRKLAEMISQNSPSALGEGGR